MNENRILENSQSLNCSEAEALTNDTDVPDDNIGDVDTYIELLNGSGPDRIRASASILELARRSCNLEDLAQNGKFHV